MKVILATSPHVKHPSVLRSDFAPDHRAMYTFAPVGLLSLAAQVRVGRPGITCELYDLNRRILSGTFSLDRTFYASVAEDICALRPDVVGFMTECDSYHHLIQITQQIKRRSRDVHVVLGGPHASAVAQPTIERCPSIDSIVVGEGEATFIRLLDSLMGTSPRHAIDGVVQRAPAAGERVAWHHQHPDDVGSARLIDALDDLPIPAYDLYSPDPGEEVFIEVGRGCPFQCTFCSTAPYWKRRHRVKSATRIVQEIRLVRELYNSTRVHFTHDLFTTNREWVRDVCHALIAAATPVRWTCSARTDTVDEDLLTLMNRAGCNAIYFGLESGSPRILREIRKDIPLQRSFDVLETCRRAGITPNVGFIAGFPTEDVESLSDTFDAYERALRLGCRPTHIFGFCPFADASIYKDLTDLECTGHFVDLPLGRDADLANRWLVASDPDLYGAYFRHRLMTSDAELDCLEGLDEFSPHVECTIAPALALSRQIGGMHEVYRRWLQWIRGQNADLPAYRRSYGSAAQFATFIRAELSRLLETPAAALDAARAIEVNLRIAESTRLVAPTSMANHRSLTVADVTHAKALPLDGRLALGSVLEMLEVEYDVSLCVTGRVDLPDRPEPTFLVWQLLDGNDVRLLSVDRMVFRALQLLSRGDGTVAEVIFHHLADVGAGPHDAPSPTLEVALSSLTNAASEGLLTLGTTSPC